MSAKLDSGDSPVSEPRCSKQPFVHGIGPIPLCALMSVIPASIVSCPKAVIRFGHG